MPTRRQPAYPFVPKSNVYLEPGQFFGIPLSDGRFAAGQVLVVPTPEIAPHSLCGTRAVAVGLLDWVGGQPPTGGEVARRKVLAWGEAHVRTIAELGSGQILGVSELDDRDDPEYVRVSHRSGGVVGLYRNGVLLRPATKDEARELPTMSTWALLVLPELAHRVFVDNLPIVP